MPYTDSEIESVVIEQEEQRECIICFKQLSPEDTCTLRCSHSLHKNCYKVFLRYKLEGNWTECVRAKCPADPDCKQPLCLSDIQQNLSAEQFNKWWLFLVKDFMACNKSFKQCPTECGNYSAKPEKRTCIQCACGHKYCFNCLQDHDE